MNFRFKERWLEAQGIPRDLIWTGRWKNPNLFRSCPERCTICGKEWRPDMDTFIPISGIAVALIDLDKWHDDQEVVERDIRWYNADFDLVLPTGHANNHFRHICWDHGGKHGRRTVNCLTGEQVYLPPSPKAKWLRDIWMDAKYWTLAVLRLVWRYISEAFFYWVRPIKSIRFFRFMKGLTHDQ